MKVRITKVPDKSMNAKKWKHGDGGFLDRYAPEDILAAIASIRAKQKK